MLITPDRPSARLSSSPLNGLMFITSRCLFLVYIFLSYADTHNLYISFSLLGYIIKNRPTDPHPPPLPSYPQWLAQVNRKTAFNTLHAYYPYTILTTVFPANPLFKFRFYYYYYYYYFLGSLPEILIVLAYRWGSWCIHFFSFRL
jgi:hypothetical protein